MRFYEAAQGRVAVDANSVGIKPARMLASKSRHVLDVFEDLCGDNDTKGNARERPIIILANDSELTFPSNSRLMLLQLADKR